MSYEAVNEDQRQPKRGGKLRGAGGSGDESADESGGRSTGIFTGFGGGQMRHGSSSGGGGGGGSGGTQIKAVVKGRYVKSGNVKSIKASARYYSTRENDRGERMERPGFSSDNDQLERKETYERLEQADREHAYHYRMVVSPGTDRDAEGVDLKDYTRTVVEEVEKEQGRVSWLAFEHSGNSAHTDRAHVHIILSTDEKFDKEDFSRMRDHASRSFSESREESRSLDRDPNMRDDIKALAELSERQREREGAMGRETGQGNLERSPAREGEQGETKREQTVQQDDAPGTAADEERDVSRNRGRDR